MANQDLVRYARHIGYNEGYNSVPQEQEKFTPEQVERYRAAFRCLELAKAVPDMVLGSMSKIL